MSRYKCVVCDSIGDYVCVCLNSEEVFSSSVFGELLIEVGSFRDLVGLVRCLTKLKSVVSKLVDVIVEYDMSQFVSTHGAMSRRVARLRKLLRIIDSMCCEDTWIVSLGAILKPVTKRLENAIEILKHFDGYVHRDRDRVHTFMYPYIMQLLGILKDDWYVVLEISSNAYIMSRIGDGEIVMEVDTRDMMFTEKMSDGEIEWVLRNASNALEELHALREILEKRIDRRRRKRRKPEVSIPHFMWSVRR